MHYGLLPRAHRGIFALNELPDLAGRIQVGLFNILQEGDVQIKGYPVRLPIDVCMVFTANPEDYTARGKIITPLKDRIGSEIRTHYPTTHRAGRRDHPAGGVDRRAGRASSIPRYVREVVEADRLRGAARQEDRPPERRLAAAAHQRPRERGEQRRAAGAPAPARRRSCRAVSDVYAALPSLTGKFELEYEGELVGRRERGAGADPRGGGRGLLDLPRLGQPQAGGGASSRRAAPCGSARAPSSEEVLAPAPARAGGAREPRGARGRRRGTRPRSWPPPASSCSRASGPRRRSAAATTAASWPPSGAADVELDLERLERLRRLKKQVN